jgi:FkbM family methyltransferase
MQLSSVAYHLPRLRRELGSRLKLGARDYRIRGYIPNHLATTFEHESHMLGPLRRAMSTRPGMVVDVGVNTGQTLLKILSIDPERPYLGFEPQIACCFFVDQFLGDNKIGNARIVCLALGDENRLLPIYTSGQLDEMASLVKSSTERYRAPSAAYFVPARIGDEVLAEMAVDNPAIVKVDVEGAELNVFRGLARILTRARPICFFEVLPNFSGTKQTTIDPQLAARNRDAAAQLLALFRDAGYTVGQIDCQGDERKIVAFDLDTPAAFIGSDYVAYPSGQ